MVRIILLLSFVFGLFHSLQTARSRLHTPASPSPTRITTHRLKQASNNVKIYNIFSHKITSSFLHLECSKIYPINNSQSKESSTTRTEIA